MPTPQELAEIQRREQEEREDRASLSIQEQAARDRQRILDTIKEKQGQPDIAPGPPLSVKATTNPDLFIVRSQIQGRPQGEYFQQTMNRQQLIASGGKVPEQEERIKPAVEPPTRQEKQTAQVLGITPQEVRAINQKESAEREDRANRFAPAGYTEKQAQIHQEYLQRRFQTWQAANAKFQEQLKAAPPELQKAFQEGGIEGFNKAVKEYNANIQANLANSTRVTGGQYIDKNILAEIKKDNPNQYRVLTGQGYDEYLKNFEKAEAVLEQYRNKDGTYNLSEAVKNKSAGVQNAIKYLFNADAINNARHQAFARQGVELLSADGTKKMAWNERAIATLENWYKDFRPPEEGGKAEGKDWQSVAEGIGATGVAALINIPILALKLYPQGEQPKKPTDIVPSMIAQGKQVAGVASEAATGMATHVWQWGENAGKAALYVAGIGDGGKFIESAKEGNFYPLAYDTAMTALILKGTYDIGRPMIGRVVTYVHPRGGPFSAIGKEISTGRINTPEAFAKEFAEAMNEVERLAATPGGEFTGTVPIKGTPYELRYLKTPLEQQVGNVLFHGTKSEAGKVSLLDVAKESGEIVAGKEGLYTDPWAAIGYTRGGENPGLLMVVTDASKIKSGAEGLAKGLTQSDAFIKGAPEGFYGSSKVWRGDLETEIVGAPGTKVKVPEPTADLATRALAGDYADFFTYDAGKFVPIKIALDAKAYSAESLAALKSPANWYAVKLYSLYGALRDAAEAIKHPGLALKDISLTLKEMANLDRMVREGTGSNGGLTMPGLRDVYVQTNLRQWLSDATRELLEKAFKKTREQLGEKVKVDSAEFRRALERNMDDVYRANADALIDGYKAVSRGYAASQDTRSKFEASYLANLGLATESLSKATSTNYETLSAVTRDVAESYPVTEAARDYLDSDRSPVSSKVLDSRGREETQTDSRNRENMTDSRDRRITSRDSRGRISSEDSRGREITSEDSRGRREPESPKSPRTPRTPETPRTPRTTGTPRTPFPPKRQAAPVSQKRAKEMIKQAGGAIAWRMGQVGKKDRWDVILNPYSNNADYIMVLGKAPAGATIVRKGPGSAYGTAQTISGQGPRREIRVDSGFIDIRVKPSGKNKVQLAFVPDPRGETRGDIQTGNSQGVTEKPQPISERFAPISDRRTLRIADSNFRRISPKPPRITPRFKRLR